jgi:signal transduction histidine kinase
VKLSTRLSLFFLGWLGVVLAGFSAALYAAASRDLYRQADERLEAALNTLAAAAEVTAEGVEWEPHERSLSFGRRAIEGAFTWRVSGERGERLDGSAGPAAGALLVPPTDEPQRRPHSAADRRGVTWRVRHRRLSKADAPAASPAPETTPSPDPDGAPDPAVFHDHLTLSAAVSLEAAQATLRNLALVLAGLSAGVWLLALAYGRRLSRRALRPVSAMAEAAHAIGDAPEGRLPVAPTGDELEELGRSFNALLDRLQESFERQRRFTGDASHQLRTPLTAIQGQVDLALRQDRDPAEYRRVLTLVQSKTRHLRRIIESLLFLARADGEALEPSLEPVDLAGWLPDHVRSWLDARRSADVRVEVTPEAGPLTARAQPALLGELVNNLLDNAAKYSEPGTPIVVRLDRDGPRLNLSVEDRGIGISADELPHVFDPFFRSPHARRLGSPGLGLGLPVALRLARSFGGTLDASSLPGQGSRFTLRLPAEDRGAEAEPARPRRPASDSRGFADSAPATHTPS